MITYEELFLLLTMLITFAALIYQICKDIFGTKK